MIYLDHNASAPLDPRVRAFMVEALRGDTSGNPSSVHSPGQRSRAAIERARRAVAGALGARVEEVVFTGGGTEADHLAIVGAMAAMRKKRGESAKMALVSSPIEHPAVLAAARRVACAGHPVVEVVPDAAGQITPAALAAALDRAGEVGLVSLAAANHELGNAAHLPGLIATVRERAPGALFHSDAVQAFGKIAVDVAALGVDLLSVSAHKIHGPRGVGALYVRTGVAVEACTGGGGQERGLRPGTEPDLLIVGFGEAARLAAAEREDRDRRVRRLRGRLLAGLDALPGTEVFGDRTASTGNTVLAGFHGCDAQLLLIALDLAGIAVSTGAACSSGTLEPSPVLLALGIARDRARSSLRISLGKDNTEADVDALLAALPPALARIRGQNM